MLQMLVFGRELGVSILFMNSGCQLEGSLSAVKETKDVVLHEPTLIRPGHVGDGPYV